MYIKFQRLLSKQLLQFCSERKSNKIVTDEKNAIYYLLQVRIEPGPSNMPDERSTTAPCHSACSIILKITIEDIQPCFNTFCYRSKLENFPYSYKPWTPYKKVSESLIFKAHVRMYKFSPSSQIQVSS